jgi:23S rRNA pseudouridine2604 synthase
VATVTHLTKFKDIYFNKTQRFAIFMLSLVSMEYPIRINKYLAEKKLSSRKEADRMIEQGQVHLNGRKAKLGAMVNENDEVQILKTDTKKEYLAYYKGRGIITHSPASGEVDIKTRLKKDYSLEHVSPVGRLDKDSEGLMILSNDGRITGPLLNPEAEHEKEYEVEVDKAVNNYFKSRMEKGLKIERYKTKPTKVILNNRNNKKFNLTLTEGKKHQIRRMCAALGFQVQSLKRVRIMNIKLGNLKPNQFRKITGPELKSFLKELGL